MWYRLGLVAMCALIVALLAALPMALLAHRAAQRMRRMKTPAVEFNRPVESEASHSNTTLFRSFELFDDGGETAGRRKLR